MQATPVRARLGSALEWLVAALFLVATIGVALLIARELRVSSPVAQAAPDSNMVLPVAVPARAISVPVLLLLDGKEVRVGDPVGNAVARSRAGAQRSGVSSLDRGARDRSDPFLRAPRHAIRPGVRAVRTQRHDESGGDLSAVGRELHAPRDGRTQSVALLRPNASAHGPV